MRLRFGGFNLGTALLGDTENVPGLAILVFAVGAAGGEAGSCGNMVDPIGGSTGLAMLGDVSGVSAW